MCRIVLEYLIKDHLFLGDFIIIQADGTEVDPNELLSIPFTKTFCYKFLSVIYTKIFVLGAYSKFAALLLNFSIEKR